MLFLPSEGLTPSALFAFDTEQPPEQGRKQLRRTNDHNFHIRYFLSLAAAAARNYTAYRESAPRFHCMQGEKNGEDQ
jgi:hypothetical protein